MSDLPFPIGSIKEQILQTVWKLGRSAFRSMLFRARISTDATIDVALSGLMREGYLASAAGDLLQLTERGYAAIEQAPGAKPPRPATPTTAEVARAPAKDRTKICRTCRNPKALDQFDRANRSPDGLTSACKGCRRTAKPTEPGKPEAPPINDEERTEAHGIASAPVETAVPTTIATPSILNIPHLAGVYARVEDDRVFISQPWDHTEATIRLNRDRGLELGRWLVAELSEKEPHGI